MPEPPDLEEREEKSSRFFLATPPGPDGFGDAEADVGAVVLAPETRFTLIWGHPDVVQLQDQSGASGNSVW